MKQLDNKFPICKIDSGMFNAIMNDIPVSKIAGDLFWGQLDIVSPNIITRIISKTSVLSLTTKLSLKNDTTL